MSTDDTDMTAEQFMATRTSGCPVRIVVTKPTSWPVTLHPQTRGVERDVD